MTIPYANSGALGANLSQVYTASTTTYPYTTEVPFAVGTQVTATDGSVWVFCLFGSGGVTGLGYVVAIDEDFLATMLSTSTDVYGQKVGVCPAAASAGQYGWVQVYGVCDDIRVEQDAAADAALAPTGDAGQLDDAGASGLYVRGLVLTTARGGTDGNAPGTLNWPVVDTIPEAGT